MFTTTEKKHATSGVDSRRAYYNVIKRRRVLRTFCISIDTPHHRCIDCMAGMVPAVADSWRHDLVLGAEVNGCEVEKECRNVQYLGFWQLPDDSEFRCLRTCELPYRSKVFKRVNFNSICRSFSPVRQWWLIHALNEWGLMTYQLSTADDNPFPLKCCSDSAVDRTTFR